jgi:hypothetical protein
VDNPRTGQSETAAVNGDVQDILVARNTIADTDNIGLDIEDWYNSAYGRWRRPERRCLPIAPKAAGIYDDVAQKLGI